MTNDRELVVFGAGGHAAMLIEAAQATGQWRSLAVGDDDPTKAGERILDIEVLGGREHLIARRGLIAVAPAIGDNRDRQELCAWCVARDVTVASVAHPGAIVSPSAAIGAGSFVAAGAVIGARAVLAEGTIVNTGATVDHDCRIGGFAHVGPGAHLCGDVTIGARTLVGVGASICPGVTIGEDCVIGAGAAIVSDIPAGVTAIGVPARIRR